MFQMMKQILIQNAVFKLLFHLLRITLAAIKQLKKTGKKTGKVCFFFAVPEVWLGICNFF